MIPKRVVLWELVNGEQIPKEFYLMHKIKHIKVCIQLIDFFELVDHVIIVMERKGISLWKFMNAQKRYLKEEAIKYIFRQVLEIVTKCQEIQVYHGDLKVENLLIDPDTREITLIDFGHGEHFKDVWQPKQAGTTVIMPPEWFYTGNYRYEDATVWMLGVLLYDLFFHEHPFEDEESIRRSVITGIRFPRRLTSDDAHFLIQQLIIPNPVYR